MRSMLTGMLISMVTISVGMWFLSSSILKYIHKPEVSSLLKNSKQSQKASSKNSAYSNSDPVDYSTESSYDSPFGPKLILKKPSQPFGPKLDLRRRRYPSRTYRRKTDTKQTEKTEKSDTKNTDSTSKAISDFKDYIDILNDQMK